MDSSYSIRKLTPNDAELWAALRWEALTQHPLAFGASPPGNVSELAASVSRRLHSSDESAVFGAFHNAKLIGIVGIVRESERKERHKARIWGMYVTASHRRAGVGESLLNTAIGEAQSWHVEQVMLSVTDVGTEAHRLYERRGFRPWGREPRAILWDGKYADEIYMVLNLDGN